jgi:hypothetical protein
VDREGDGEVMLVQISTERQRWLDWHGANPHVYDLFKRFTFEAIDRGHRKLSAWLIVNRIRWETTVETNGGDFKISNNFIAYYARLFMDEHPEYRGFFRTKPLKGGE